MPTKTIYVATDDQETFDKAQTLAGENLSSVIVRSLREFIARYETMHKGFKEIKVQVGSEGLQREKRFIGRKLIDWNGVTDIGEWLDARAYLTQKNAIVVSLRHLGSPELWKSDAWKKPELWTKYRPGTELVICKDIKAAHATLPVDLARQIEQAIERNETPVEYLDI